MRFLIVDDSKAIQAIVRRTLQKTGIADLDYKAASDGLEALRIMDDWKPDMVLTDWHMPGMTGIELLKSIRNRGWNDLKVAFVTTESAQSNLAEAKRLGAVFFINKPFQDDDLIRLINGALGSAPVVELATPITVTVDSPDAVTGVLDSILERKVMVMELPNEGADDIRLPSAVALYVHEASGEIRALCLLDHTAIVLVGAASASLPEVSRFIEANDVPKEIWDAMLRVVESNIPRLFLASDGSKLKLLKTQLLKQKPEQLREIMRRSPCRSDFSLTRAKLGPGQITLISK
ncbi:MAG: response regulator [Rhodocyclaceae bacterium]|jgi:CheY-like chemotaxis protein|nr:response regulator [Rhodocyclaceae bacterium]